MRLAFGGFGERRDKRGELIGEVRLRPYNEKRGAKDCDSGGNSGRKERKRKTKSEIHGWISNLALGNMTCGGTRDRRWKEVHAW